MSNVNNPSHYGGKNNPYEAIKVMRARLTPQEFVGACKFSYYTYMDRHKEKGGFEDLEKATWYHLEMIRYVKEVGYDTIYPSKAAIPTPDVDLTDDDLSGIGQ